MTDLKLAFRSLTKSPLVTSIAVVSLALGIGANAAIYSLYDQMLLQTLPVEEPGRLVNLAAPGPNPGSQSCNQAGDCQAIFSYPMFKDLEGQVTGAFAGIAAHRLFGANLATPTRTVNGQGLLVSGSYFSTLGLRPALGRLLGPSDDQTVGAHFVAVLSHEYWENDLGADPSMLNQSITVNGHPLTIVGVAPRGFVGTTLGGRPDLFVPITMRDQMVRGWQGFDNRRSYWAYLFGRLRPDATIEQARAEINAAYGAIINEVEAELQRGMSDQTMERFRAKQLTLEPGSRGQSQLPDQVSMPMILLLSITTVVLLIACANIANLLLTRGANRSLEMAVRSSLGASRRALLTQLLTESLLLALLGAVASLLVAFATMRVVGAILPPQTTDALTLALRPVVALFAGVASLGSAVIFGLYPALYSTRADLISVIKAGSGQPGGARSAARFRAGLVTGQIALSMTLLMGAGLFIKSLSNVIRIDLGLSTDNVVTFGLSPVLNGYAPEESQALFTQVEEALAAYPGVTGVSAALVPILSNNSWGNDVNVEGFERGPDIDANSRYNEVGPAYFSTLGIPLVAGREFTLSDRGDAPGVAVVNQAFAEKFGIAGPDVVGKRMSQGGQELDIEIIGLARDAKYNQVKGVVPPVFFIPYKQDDGIGFVTFYVRTGSDPEPVARAIPDIVRQLDANLPVEDMKTLQQQVRENVNLDRLTSMLSSAFAVLATLLAAVGLYGVLAFAVAQRTREIGLRMALGADGRRVRRMVLRQVGLMTALGGIVGLGVALLLGRAAQSLLFEMQGHDPTVAGIVIGLLGVVALSAGYVPALRASRVEPMQALRHE